MALSLELFPNAESLATRTADPASAIRSQIGDPKSKIGLVGPMSNYATAPQLVENIPSRDIGEMHRFAHTWRAVGVSGGRPDQDHEVPEAGAATFAPGAESGR